MKFRYYTLNLKCCILRIYLRFSLQWIRVRQIRGNLVGFTLFFRVVLGFISPIWFPTFTLLEYSKVRSLYITLFSFICCKVMTTDMFFLKEQVERSFSSFLIFYKAIMIERLFEISRGYISNMNKNISNCETNK